MTVTYDMFDDFPLETPYHVRRDYEDDFFDTFDEEEDLPSLEALWDDLDDYVETTHFLEWTDDLAEPFMHLQYDLPHMKDVDIWHRRDRRGKLVTLRTHRDRTSIGGCHKAVIRNVGRRWTTALSVPPGYNHFVIP